VPNDVDERIAPRFGVRITVVGESTVHIVLRLLEFVFVEGLPRRKCGVRRLDDGLGDRFRQLGKPLDLVRLVTIGEPSST